MDKSTLICTRSFYCPNITGSIHNTVWAATQEATGVFYTINDGSLDMGTVDSKTMGVWHLGFSASYSRAMYNKSTVQPQSLRGLTIVRI